MDLALLALRDKVVTGGIVDQIIVAFLILIALGLLLWAFDKIASAGKMDPTLKLLIEAAVLIVAAILLLRGAGL